MVKREKTNIWILEPGRRGRPAVYPVEKMVDRGDKIDIIYRHGRRIKTTYITSTNTIEIRVVYTPLLSPALEDL